MSRTVRFPLVRAVPSVGPAEPELVIVLQPALASIPVGGGNLYTSIAPWKTILRNTESPYSCCVIEILATAAMTIGDGTFAQQIALYGGINNAAGVIARKEFLGVLGIARGGVAPQIPIVDSGSGLVAYAQMFSNIACYDSLAIGGVVGAVAIAGGQSISVTARPIRSREYLG